MLGNCSLAIISPVNESFLFVSGIYLTAIMTLSIVTNGLLLFIVIRFESIKNPFNYVIVIMTAFNLFGCLQFPFVIASHFYKRLL